MAKKARERMVKSWFFIGSSNAADYGSVFWKYGSFPLDLMQGSDFDCFTRRQVNTIVFLTCLFLLKMDFRLASMG